MKEVMYKMDLLENMELQLGAKMHDFNDKLHLHHGK